MGLFMKFLGCNLVVILRGVLGAIMELHKVIIKPAYWALYGAVFGMLMALAVEHFVFGEAV